MQFKDYYYRSLLESDEEFRSRILVRMWEERRHEPARGEKSTDFWNYLNAQHKVNGHTHTTPLEAVNKVRVQSLEDYFLNHIGPAHYMWALKRWVSRGFKLRDIDSVARALERFDEIKNQLPRHMQDLDQYTYYRLKKMLNNET